MEDRIGGKRLHASEKAHLLVRQVCRVVALVLLQDLPSVAGSLLLERTDRMAEDGSHAQRALHPVRSTQHPRHEVVRPIDVLLVLLPVPTLGSLSDERARNKVQGLRVLADVILWLDDISEESVHTVESKDGGGARRQALSQIVEVAPPASVLGHGGHEQCTSHVGSQDLVGHVQYMPQAVGLANVVDRDSSLIVPLHEAHGRPGLDVAVQGDNIPL